MLELGPRKGWWEQCPGVSWLVGQWLELLACNAHYQRQAFQVGR